MLRSVAFAGFDMGATIFTKQGVDTSDVVALVIGGTTTAAVGQPHAVLGKFHFVNCFHFSSFLDLVGPFIYYTM